MTVVEADTEGVAADGFGAGDADLALLHGRRGAVAAMALCFGAGAFDAQEFIGDCGFVSVIEADEEFSPIFLEAQFSGPGGRLVGRHYLAAPMSRASSRSITGTPLRMGKARPAARLTSSFASRS